MFTDGSTYDYRTAGETLVNQCLAIQDDNIVSKKCDRDFSFICMKSGKVQNLLIFSTTVSTAVLMQSVICKPYIFTKQPKITRQCTPQAETTGGR